MATSRAGMSTVQRSLAHGNKRVSSAWTSTASNIGASTSQRPIPDSAEQAPEVRRDSAKTKRRLRETHDNKLRKAIEIYHLASRFFPAEAKTSAAASSQPAPSASAKTASAQSSESEPLDPLDHMLDTAIRTSIMPLTSGSHFNDRIQQKTIRMMTAQAVHSAENETRFEREILPSDFANFMLGGISRAPPKVTDLPRASDEDAVKGYIAHLARTDAHDMAVQNRNLEVAESLDSRSARVRDAIFGTTRGSRPGLEIVRDRAETERLRHFIKKRQEEDERKMDI